MAARWTAWHFFFGILLRRRGPRGLDLRDEVPLSDEPPRIDYLLIRRPADGGSTQDDEAETLRRLWPMLPRVSVVEYKSPTHPYRSGHLDRLWGYVHIHFANQCALPRRRADGTELSPGMPGAPEVHEREELCAVLVVARRTPSLDTDIAAMGLRWEGVGAGYWKVRGGLFALVVVEIDVVGPSEGDDLLYSLGHGKPATAAARRFWAELVGSREVPMNIQDMEGYDEVLDRLLSSLPLEQRLAGLAPEERLAGLAPEQRLAGLAPEQRLAGLAPEQRLAGLAPEQRLAGLDHDHQALALPIDVLRLLPEDYLQSLSPEVQAELRRRLEKNGH